MNRAIFKELQNRLEGEVKFDNIYRTIYATDASAYKEKPVAVILPNNKEDIKKIINFASENELTIIPRTAGTSIAGQVVGNGIVVDVSKYMTDIIELNKKEKWVRVQPGVVLDELNMYLKPYGLFFGPETSTSNRCMIGGMVGNNSCGAHSLIYGSTRDHTLELKTILADGSEVIFKSLDEKEFNEKCKLNNLEGSIYRKLNETLGKAEVQKQIRKEFPDPALERRNTGYAIDVLIENQPFNSKGEKFNMCKLLAGSEGTLAFTTEIKLNLVDLPPKEKGLLVIHHESIEESLRANILALEFKPGAIELIDKYILDLTKNSREHSKNRFFLDGDPEALLCIEFARNTKEEITEISEKVIKAFKKNGFGYAYPLLFGNDIAKVWSLRKAGLGLLSNVPGDAKPQPVIEDTAVNPKVLPEYIKEFNFILEKHKLSCVYYAHIATGELHLRPVFELKSKAGQEMFHTIAEEIAILVKKYNGSLSGEHGDGRLRGEFIPFMIGKENYEILKELKRTWDPKGIFNHGKITDTPKMNTFLRYEEDQVTPEIDTVFDFSESMGLVRMAEKCNGSADCRKSAIIGGTMCPSYQASRNEDTTTRARANLLREALNNNIINNIFNNKEVYNILDLCLSCKGCKTECPSGVDMAKMKAEYLHHYYKKNKISLRTWMIAHFTKIQSIASKFAGLYNSVITNHVLSVYVKRIIGFAKKRSLPKVYRKTLLKWINQNLHRLNSQLSETSPMVYFFVDEFTNYNDVPIGIIALKLLHKLGYRIKTIKHKESGRAYISKGLLDKPRKLAKYHVSLFSGIINEEEALVGLEPSAILTFRDEYPDLLRGKERDAALDLAKNVFTIEEFLSREIDKGRIRSEMFTEETAEIKFHGHCQQKAVSGTGFAKKILSLPNGYNVTEIKSGCCGMAGSFGYEKEHYDLSMKVGELVLFPAVRSSNGSIIVASGTSCRHQIKDGTEKQAFHPVEVLFNALK